MATLTGIDFALGGKQFGHLAIPYSTNVSAYGKIVVPVVQIRNGDGPRALISAGVHGDEFEGQIALRKLCLDLSPDEIRGTLLILPMANTPAILSSSRVSPVDGLNLNRVFPGNRLGSPTEVIASVVEDQLLENCDFAYDIHSGGSSLLYGAVGVTTATGSEPDDRRRLDLLRALGLEAGMLLPAHGNMGFESSVDGAMLRKNVIGVSAEFGGGGTLSAEMLRACEQSIRRFLSHVGLARHSAIDAPAKSCRIYDVDGADAHVFSESAGIFNATISPGSVVRQGEVIGHIYDLYDLNAKPNVIICNQPGTVLALRSLPRVEVGDCLAQIGRRASNEGGQDDGI